jgi:Putative DNA-binding domain
MSLGSPTTNAGSLADLQRAFQDYLLSDSDRLSASVRDTRKADRVTLLDVYRDGYALRLIEVLTNDYPGVMAMAGPADFDYMARAYIAAHPSHHPSVRWFGKDLADFLAGTPPFNRSPAVAEMARFEWALGDAFDSTDVSPIAAQALIDLPPEAWETLAFTTLSSLRVLSFDFDVPRAWQQRDEQEAGNLEVARADAPTSWVIWRPQFTSNFRSLATDEAMMLAVLMEERPFPELCECLIPSVGEEQAPARAAGLLRGWVEEGMIGSFRH